MANLITIWSARAKAELKHIYDYLKYEKKTPQGAANVRRDILAASKGLKYAQQYQMDDIDLKYRRIVVRHYKLIYKEENGIILILRIFDIYQDPTRLLKDTE